MLYDFQYRLIAKSDLLFLVSRLMAVVCMRTFNAVGGHVTQLLMYMYYLSFVCMRAAKVEAAWRVVNQRHIFHFN